MGFDWQWDFAIEILPALLAGLGNSLLATLLGYGLALFLGVALLTLQRTRWRWFNFVVREVVNFIRTTPLLVQLFFVFYVLPQAGVVLSPWVTGMITIGLHYGTYLCGVYRGALFAVPRGQWEACKALNMPGWKAYLRIILPQALVPALPGLRIYLTGCLKDTSMLATIALPELLNVAAQIGTNRYRYLEPYTVAAVLSLCVTIPVFTLLSLLDRPIARALGLRK